MGLTLTEVHQVRQDRETGRMRMVGKNPYTRFIQEGETPVIVQNGAFWTDGGDRIPDSQVPTWVWDALRKVTDDGLRNIGLDPIKVHDKHYKRDRNKPAGVQDLNNPMASPEAVRKALGELNHDDDAHWTKSGLPDLTVLTEMVGHYVRRSLAEQVAPGFRRYGTLDSEESPKEE